MNYEEIKRRLFEAKRLAYGTLVHILSNLPEMGGRRMEYVDLSDFRSACSITLDRRYLVMRVYYECGIVCFDGLEWDTEKQVTGLKIFSYDRNAVVNLLWRINSVLGPDLMAKIPPYERHPQTLLVCGEENVRAYLDFPDDEEGRGEMKEWLGRLERPELVRRSWLTDSERKAYIKGCDDATGWLETAIPDNRDRYLDA